MRRSQRPPGDLYLRWRVTFRFTVSTRTERSRSDPRNILKSTPSPSEKQTSWFTRLNPTHTHTHARGNMRRHSNVRVKWAEADLETVNSAPHLSVKVTSNRFTLFSVNHFVTSAPLKRSEQRRAASRRQSPGCLIKSHKLPLNFPEVRFTVEAGSRVTFR